LSTEELVSTRAVSPSPRVSIVGVGGAGNNLLSRAIVGGISPDDCIAVNTDKSQLSRSAAINKILLDGESVEGSDATPQNSSSRRMLQLSAHRVKPFTESSDCTILLAGLGGGTATETAPAIAQVARSSIRPVISVVAIPFIHERERRFVAMRGLKHMVDACDCTVVVDNAVEDAFSHPSKRQADEKASLAVQTLTELMSKIDPGLIPEALRIMSLGPIALICSAPVLPTETIQRGVIQALRAPSANLPLAKTMGAVLIQRGPTRMGEGEAAQAYDALVSLIGRDVEFMHTNVESSAESTVCLLLTGYDYGTAVRAFVDFIEDLYDIEYGQPSENSLLRLHSPLFQMEWPC